ncbi:hypothetical protein GCM10010503_40920 [Streptomyces lucensis JCM 4490]|uniref:Uncharacterized protein n=1 Tax=Streptomyces lucensis JCM 4490 TaxID=1306176 RepID=A0A918J943_9ACTN|nr:hypothetical protein [Streptomyces lucensis]GGW59550.1 hypothetical protein GCM10010503_40920 [Streptomyces lucensis JCM 4490]
MGDLTAGTPVRADVHADCRCDPTARDAGGYQAALRSGEDEISATAGGDAAMNLPR